MIEMIRVIVGIVLVILGFPIGNLLAHVTKEELKSGQRWFKLIILLGFVGGIVSLILGNDALLFGFLFIAIVTSRSLEKKNKKEK